VPDERDKPGLAEPPKETADDNERPTVSPPFDPAALAREVMRPSPQPMPATRPTPQHGVATPPGRKKTPPGLGPPPASRRKTPTSTLSLLNARIPSSLPEKGALTPRRASEAPGRGSTAPRDPAAGSPRESSVPTAPRRASRIPQTWPGLSGPAEEKAIAELDEVTDEHTADTVRRPVADEAPVSRVSEREMNDRVALGDYTGALEIAEALIERDAQNEAARLCAENCRAILRQMYAARIGSLDRVPTVMIPRDQLRWLSIDHKAGFVLSLVDGVSSVEMIIDVSGMPELDTLRILADLAQQRIITLRG